MIAQRLAGGELELPAPLFLECASQWETPADGLEAVFPAGGLEGCGELTGVRLELDGAALFEGPVDEQILTADGGGQTLTLRARGPAAVLLDNEAVPRVYYRPSLLDIYNAHARQYGFRGLASDANPSLASYTVAKGKSEWQALEGFCRQALGLRPYVRDGWVVARRRGPGRELAISNTAAGALRYLLLRTAEKRYGVISKVILKSERGLYDLPVLNPLGEAYQIRRKRYVSPPKEWAGNPRAGAQRMMRDSMAKKRLVTAVLPGLAAAAVGDRASVEGGPWLAVIGVTHRADGNGRTTELTLAPPEYWD